MHFGDAPHHFTSAPRLNLNVSGRWGDHSVLYPERKL
jgi:hypothetical protein